MEGIGGGFIQKQLRDARERLGVISSKSGFDGGWIWSMREVFLESLHQESP
jgi:hypothetical protein